MPREYPDRINCPSCGEPGLARHCPKYRPCNWYWCAACQQMTALGNRNPLTMKWKVLKRVPWQFPR